MRILFFAVCFISLSLISSCKKDNSNPQSIENALGYGVLEKVRGIWSGPVTSTTALGGFQEWIIDFRPISASHISSKNELNTENDIFMSFFIAKYNNEYRVAFRNGGYFAGSYRISYFLADSVYESGNESYYRFSEIFNNTNRAYTEVFAKGDSLKIHSSTNRYNTQTSATPHMAWNAKRQDMTSSQPAKDLFGFPEKQLEKDLSQAFTGRTESIFYAPGGDPFPESEMPHLGSATVSYSFAQGFNPDSNKNVLLMLTTQPLIEGFSYNPDRLRYRSRYVILNSTENSFNFNYLHPGTYYVYALYDKDGNQTFNSGDWLSTGTHTFTLSSKGTASSNAVINFEIP
jgi:hypothetical protein